MKNRIVIALLLAGILILPAFAQQSSNSQTQPATQSAPTDLLCSRTRTKVSGAN